MQLKVHGQHFSTLLTWYIILCFRLCEIWSQRETLRPQEDTSPIPSSNKSSNPYYLKPECDDMPKCSHDCFGQYPYAITCYCYGQPSNSYCPSETFIVYQDEQIEVIGFNQDNTVYNRKLLNQDTKITSVAYNSQDGIILFVTSGQVMFTWKTSTAELENIHESSNAWDVQRSAYDRDGNNWFIVDRVSFSIYVISQNTFGMAQLIQGNNTHFPVDIALFPEIGFMFILWSINGHTVIRCRPMTADPNAETEIYVDESVKSDDGQLEPAFLQICKKTEPKVEFWLFNKEKPNTAILFEATRKSELPSGWDTVISNFQFFTPANSRREFTPVYRFKYKVVCWTDDSNTIKCGNADVDAGNKILTYTTFDPITPKFIKGQFRMMGVIDILPLPPKSSCFYRNGWCAHICLPEEFNKKACKCADDLKDDFPNSSSCELDDKWTTESEKARSCIEQQCVKLKTESPLQLGVILLLIVLIILLTITVIKQFM